MGIAGLPSYVIEDALLEHALERVLPELDSAWANRARYQRSLRELDSAAGRGRALEVRYAVLACALAAMPQSGDAPQNALRNMSARLRAPSDCAELALLALRQREQIALGVQPGAEAVVALFQTCDAWRRPERFGQLLQAVEDAGGKAAKPGAAAGFPAVCRSGGPGRWPVGRGHSGRSQRFPGQRHCGSAPTAASATGKADS